MGSKTPFFLLSCKNKLKSIAKVCNESTEKQENMASYTFFFINNQKFKQSPWKSLIC